jgi:hypothetical protein
MPAPRHAFREPRSEYVEPGPRPEPEQVRKGPSIVEFFSTNKEPTKGMHAAASIADKLTRVARRTAVLALTWLMVMAASDVHAQLTPNGFELPSPLTGNEIVDCQVPSSPYITTCTTGQIGALAAGGGVTVGDPITGACPDKDLIYSNATAVGCQSPTVQNTTTFAGSTVGARIAACVAALPSTGGVCDARGEVSGGTIPAMTLSTSGVSILGPCGLFTVTGTIDIVAGPATSINAFQWTGCGAPFNINTSGTVFTWGGNATDPMFRCRGCIYSGMEGIKIVARSGLPLLRGVQFETKTGANSGTRTLKNMVFEGTDSGITDAIIWCTGNTAPYSCGSSGGAGPDANNDIDYLENIICFNYKQSCAHMLGTQVQGIHFYHNTRVGAAGQTAYGVYDQGGSFFSEADGGGGNGGADFYIPATPGTVTISNYNGESSNRFLQVGTSASAFSIPVNIIGGRWAADQLNADNNVILQYGIGPLTVNGFEVDGTGGASAPQFMIWPNTAPVSATAIGVKIVAPNATITTNPFVAGAGNTYGQWTSIGTQLTGGTPTNIHVPDYLYADNASKPVVSSCGSSVPAVTTFSKNFSGQITLGGGTPTACTATFFTAFPNAAFCTVTPVSDLGAGVRYWLTQSASAFIVNLSAGVSGAVFNYNCGGG